MAVRSILLLAAPPNGSRFLLSLASCTGADDASEIVLLFLYSYQAFLPPPGRPSSVTGVFLQDLLPRKRIPGDSYRTTFFIEAQTIDGLMHT